MAEPVLGGSGQSLATKPFGLGASALAMLLFFEDRELSNRLRRMLASLRTIKGQGQSRTQQASGYDAAPRQYRDLFANHGISD